MSKVDDLLKNYERHISVPWRQAAPAQRVIFCVYDEEDERRLRARITEFELATRAAGCGWKVFDLTDTFAQWLALQRYAVKYFQQPQLLPMILPNYLADITSRFSSFLQGDQGDAADSNTVVALKGVGSLFGFLKVKEVVDNFAPLVPGRLLVFFPGAYEQNNYRLLDAYDGWNYLAVPITAGREF